MNTTTINYRKLLLSAIVVAFVSSLIFAGTLAFFSDTETSSGNTFTAGEIDLTVDSVAHYNGLVCFNDEWVPEGAVEWNAQAEALVELDDTAQAVIDFNAQYPNHYPQAGTECGGTWALTDITPTEQGPTYTFFDYDDIKPGDDGKNTISLHLDTNDGYVCAIIDNLVDNDNGLTEPESEDGDNTGGDGEGELSSELNFFAWGDDGDNIWEDGELPLFSNIYGPASDVANGVVYDLFTPANGNVMPAGTTAYVGMYWCFGDIDVDQVSHTLSCDGSATTNVTQTDSMTADISFYVEQSRNNENFVCPAIEPEEPAREAVGDDQVSFAAPLPDDCNATITGDNSIQSAVDSATDGDVVCVDPTYTGFGDTFPLTLNVTNLTLTGLGNAGDATLPGGTFIDADGVTFTGLTVDNYNLIQASENAAVYIHNGVSGVSVTHNSLLAPAGAVAANAKGIVTEIGDGVTPGASGLSITHNIVNGWNQGMFFNTANYDVAYNTITNNTVGVANDGPHASAIHHNNFAGNSAEAVGVAPTAVNDTTNDGVLTVNTNNLGAAGAGNDVNHYLASNLGGADVDATGNWWDGEVEAARTNDTAEVDTSSPEAVAFPLN